MLAPAFADYLYVKEEMAKGMRSKSKRANRAALRTQLTQPLQDKTQEKLAKRLVASVEEQSGVEAIKRLKKLLAGKKAAAVASKQEKKKLAMDPENPEGPDDLKKPVQMALVTLRKASFSFRDELAKNGQDPKPLQRRGSRQ